MMKILLAIAVSILDPPKAHKLLTMKGKDQRAEIGLGFGLFVLLYQFHVIKDLYSHSFNPINIMKQDFSTLFRMEFCRLDLNLLVHKFHSSSAYNPNFRSADKCKFSRATSGRCSGNDK